MTGHDPTAPDAAGARERYPDWEIRREPDAWKAVHRRGLAGNLTALSLEALEGKLTRAEQVLRTAGGAARRGAS
jgi:hypothetical protein